MNKTRSDAANTVVGLLIGGLLATLAGLLLAASQWRVKDSGYESYATDTHGHIGLVYLGLGVASLGQLAMLAGVVAWGVFLGIRWTGLAGSQGQVTLDRESAPPPQRATTYLDADGR